MAVTKECAAFVGRGTELAYLGGALDRVIAGYGIAVLVGLSCMTLSKLGVRGRVDAATIALRHSLVVADGPDR